MASGLAANIHRAYAGHSPEQKVPPDEQQSKLAGTPRLSCRGSRGSSLMRTDGRETRARRVAAGAEAAALMELTAPERAPLDATTPRSAIFAQATLTNCAVDCSRDG